MEDIELTIFSISKQKKSNEINEEIKNSHTTDCEQSAYIGDENILRLAHEKGGILNDNVYHNALEYGMDTGNFECYKYVIANIE
jgi:hypothetical protein